jgi:excisionase family DNA binding protein
MAQPMMTVREAADHFEVSDKTIRKWIKSGRLVAELRSGPTGKQ